MVMRMGPNTSMAQVSVALNATKGRSASPHKIAVAGTAATPAGIMPRTSFSCEARCLCPAGDDTVWVGERSGVISVRCARTGKVLNTVQVNSTTPVFATCMMTSDAGEMWVGSNDGRVFVFTLKGTDLVSELRSPETEKVGEVTAIALEGTMALVSCENHRVSLWHAVKKEFMTSLVHSAGLTALAVRGGVCYSCDKQGYVIAWDLHTHLQASSFKCESPTTAIVFEPTTQTLWVALVDGSINVLRATPTLELLESVSNGPKARLNSLLAVGGKVWGAGLERTTFVWHATSRRLLGRTKDHTAFIFQLSKLYALETSRVWSLSNDKTIQVYDAEGFFQPVVAHGQAGDELAQAHATAQTMKRKAEHLEKQLLAEEEKVAARGIENEKLKDDLHKQLLKLHALEHVVDMKDESLLGGRSERTRLAEETAGLRTQITDLQSTLNAAEAQKLELRGDISKAEETATLVRSEVAAKASAALVAETEKKALETDNQRLQARIRHLEESVAKAEQDTKTAQDEVVARGLDVNRRMKEAEGLADRVRQLEAQVADRDAKWRAADEARRALDDRLIVRDNELKLMAQKLQKFEAVKDTQATELQSMETARQADVHSVRTVQDNLLLKSHEADLMKAERQKLDGLLQHERQQLEEARGSERRLASQNEELRRQLEKEKSSVRMLEEQYTIFQFVINSRGELVNSIWGLHGKVMSAMKTIRALESGIAATDPTKDKLTLKREWRLNIVDRARSSADDVSTLQEKLDYIIANYMSEYEKMHLGIPTAKFAPDTSRPTIVGDALLTKLRDVTLLKQIPAPTHDSKVQRLPPPSGSSLGPEHFASAPKPPRPQSASGRLSYSAGSALPASTRAGLTNENSSAVLGRSVRPLP